MQRWINQDGGRGNFKRNFICFVSNTHGVSQHSLLFLDAVLATCRTLQLKICDWSPYSSRKEGRRQQGKGGRHRLGEEYWHEQMKTNRKSAASKKELKGKESIWLGKCLLERTKILSKVRHSETSSFFFLDASPVAQHLRTFCLCSQGNDRKHTEIKGVCWPSASVLVHGAAVL